ncbi:hypothetical protein ACIBCM_30960 [Streptomyces sp. NPDC051018]|uniref:hypothetical protein n=1 Tax=Streptomyces sp. NPDC051018 TaxID=3365639 RepID=UPI0037B6981E
MPQQENTDLKAEYADKVRADLERNTAEQDRIRAEIDTLQTELTTLEKDHELLRSMSAALGDATQVSAVPSPRRGRKAVGGAPAAKSPAAGKPAAAGKRAAKKAPAKKTAVKSTAAKATAAKPAAEQSGAKKPVAKKPAVKKPAAKKSAVKKPADAKAAASTAAVKAGAGKEPAAKAPALGDLIHGHLGTQTEPRTAREIAQALTDAHPGRNISDNLVRTTTERLVARSRVERVKQGATVYYTAVRADAASAGTNGSAAVAGTGTASVEPAGETAAA